MIRRLLLRVGILGVGLGRVDHILFGGAGCQYSCDSAEDMDVR